MDLFLQTLANGLVLGASYAVIAVGLTLVFGILHIANFAHGAFYAIGAYGVLLLNMWGVPYLLTLPLAVVLVAIVAFIIEYVVIRHAVYGDSHHGSIIVTFAIGQALTAGLVLIFGPDPHPIASPFSQSTWSGLGILIAGQRIFIMLSSMLVLAGFGAWLRYTTKGQQVLAVAQNPKGALYSGINVPMIRSLSFIVGVAAAGFAGALMAPIVTAFPTMGHTTLITGFTVVILGGMGSIAGALLGSLLIGVGNAMFETYVSVSWTPALGWILVIAVLLLWPQGLLGRPQLHRH
jgi:branched-subunit amino acid ABC-type transport system permease component